MKVAVIGGAGYVGLALCAELQNRGHDVTAVTRANGRFLLDPIGVRVIAPDALGEAGPQDVVINLAYPNRGSAYEYPRRNRELLAMIATLARGSARVMHTSTQAVFGFALEYPCPAGPIRQRRDYVYIESKIELENLLAKSIARGELHIVRLGNIWGPASPTWTAAVADKLLFGNPVGVVGEDGYCNAAGVANVVSYLAFLVETPPKPGVHYHHLAELSDTKWSWWIERMATVIGVAPVIASRGPGYPESLRGELAETWKRHSPISIAREWMYGRFTGSLYRSAIRVLPNRAVSTIKRRRSRRSGGGPVAVVDSDPVFLTIMRSARRFESQVDTRWTPVADRDQSWEAIREWMQTAGY